MDVFEEARQLSQVPIFSKLEESKLKLLAFTSERFSLADQEYLFHKDDNSDSVYLILDGVLQLVLEYENDKVEVLLERGKNELIGEMGVITNSPRSASIRASHTATVLKISADTFMTLLLENPSVSLQVIRELSNRLNQSLSRETKASESDYLR